MNRRAPLFAGVGIVVLAALLVAFLVLPKMGDVEEAEGRLEEAEAREFALQTELSRLEESAEDAARLRSELAGARRAVPRVADLPGLINELQTAADVAGVDFFSIAPGAPLAVQGATATEIPTQVQVIGGFFPVDEFLFRLESLPRAAKVVSLSVGEGIDGLPQINVQMSVLFYTTDLEAGPGSAPPAVPGETTATPSPASPSPGTSPAPETSPAPTESPDSGGVT